MPPPPISPPADRAGPLVAPAGGEAAGAGSGRAYPPRPLVGVGVVVLAGDAVLLVRRKRPPRAGEWSVPGGLQKLGETVAEAGRREVLEETGIEVVIAGLVDVVDLIDRDPADGRIRWHYTLVDLFAVAAEAAAPLARSDAAAAQWHGGAALARLALWEETRRIIDRARRLRDAALPTPLRR